MNPIFHQWLPVALSAQLRNKPVASQLHDTPLVLFRTSEGRAAALPDRCPHRFAPLSAGKVCNGQIECPYHGWRFSADGRCTRIPGNDQASGSKPLLDSLACCEAYGLVWVSLSTDPPLTPPVAPAQQHQILDTFWITDRVQCSLQDAAENFLDGFHTHFVHSGWIRHDKQRQKISAQVHPLADGVEAVYSEESKQSGIISRLFERERGVSMGRFRMPCLAEIEYRGGDDALNLLVSVWLVPCGNGQLQLFARIATKRSWLPAIIKHYILSKLFRVILRQDRLMLEKVTNNKLRFPDSLLTPLDGEQDLLGPSIRKLLEDGQPLIFEERQFSFWL